MACTRPKRAWISANGTWPSGAQKLTFAENQGIRGAMRLVPCGQCYLCRTRQRMDWSTRLHHESFTHKQIGFLTVTFDDKYLPQRVEWSQLEPLWQWLKTAGVDKMFAVGEYGFKTKRPHFHLITYGRDFMELNQIYEWDRGQFRSTDLEEAWGQGFVTTAPLQPGGCDYVTGYVQKKLPKEDGTDPWAAIKKQTARPALGRSFCESFLDDILTGEACVVNGYKRPIPAVYFDWYPDELEPVRAKNEQYAMQFQTVEQRQQQKRNARNKALNKKSQAALYSGAGD